MHLYWICILIYAVSIRCISDSHKNVTLTDHIFPSQTNFHKSNIKNSFLDNFQGCFSEYSKNSETQLITFILELIGFGIGHLYANRICCFIIKFCLYTYLLLLIFLYPILVVCIRRKFEDGYRFINKLSILLILSVLGIFALIIYDLILLFN